MRDILLTCIKLVALVRSVWLLVILVRVIPVHLRARSRKWGLIEALTFLELPAFLGLTYFLVSQPPTTPSTSSVALIMAVVGAFLTFAGLALSLWAIYTTIRQHIILDVGHFVKKDHPLITTGAYGFIRNPMYLSIILFWFGAAVAFQNLVVLAISVLYIVPDLWFYILSEERMMLNEFGVQFEEYMHTVGRLFPRLRRPNT